MRGRKILINMLLTALFVIFSIVIIIPFWAESELISCEKLASKILFEQTEVKFEHVAAIDFFDAKCLSEFGDFLIKKLVPVQNRLQRLEKAKSFYKTALRLNSVNGEYYIKLGQAQVMIYLEMQKLGPYSKDLNNLPGEAITYFRLAIRHDPNGFNISYSSGYAGLALWKFLSKEDRDFVLGRLHYCLSMRPWYSKYIYPKTWNETKNFLILQKITPTNLMANEELYNFIVSANLWQFRKDQMKLLVQYRIKEEGEQYEDEKRIELKRLEDLKRKYAMKPNQSNIVLQEDWAGTASDGVNSYKKGAMFWSGTMDAAIRVPAGEPIFKIQARGDLADGVYPYMIVKLDGEDIGETSITSTEWHEYIFKTKTNGGIKVLGVTFVNDWVSKDGKEDRNLYIGNAEII